MTYLVLNKTKFEIWDFFIEIFNHFVRVRVVRGSVGRFCYSWIEREWCQSLRRRRKKGIEETRREKEGGRRMREDKEREEESESTDRWKEREAGGEKYIEGEK